jgi:serine/threonine protein phosphatase 1
MTNSRYISVERSDWRDLPDGGASSAPLFVIGDVHGEADLLEEMLAQAPKDAIVIFLGDLHDRGEYGLRAINLAWRARSEFRGWAYLPGNHEVCLYYALTQGDKNLAFQYWYDAYQGYPMCEELALKNKDSSDVKIAALLEALPQGFLHHIACGAGFFQSGTILAVHAGIAPIGDRAAFLSQSAIGGYVKDQHYTVIREDFLNWKAGWDRMPIGSGASPTIIVHGHSKCASFHYENIAQMTTDVDRIDDLRRINLDINTDLKQIAAAEIRDGVCRFSRSKENKK